MDQGEIRARIRAIRHQLTALLRELDHLLTLLDRGDDPPARFRLIPGGIAVLITALGAIAGWGRRRPAAAVGALVAAGTAVLVLVAPQGGTAPVQQLSLPPAASLSTPEPQPTVTTTPSALEHSVPSATAAASIPPSLYIPPPTPTASGTAPSLPSSTAPGTQSPPPPPTSNPTPTSTHCILEAVVPGILRLCVA